MSVFAMVPMASCPMFMPERNRALRGRSGFSSRSSQQAEEMDMATSMTAPSEAMRMPLTNRPLIFSPRSDARRTSSSASGRLKPLSGDIDPHRAAKMPATATPPMQPSVAQSVLRLKPFRNRSEAAVVSATSTTVTTTGCAPRRIMGT